MTHRIKATIDGVSCVMICGNKFHDEMMYTIQQIAEHRKILIIEDNRTTLNYSGRRFGRSLLEADYIIDESLYKIPFYEDLPKYQCIINVGRVNYGYKNVNTHRRHNCRKDRRSMKRKNYIKQLNRKA